MHTRLFPHQGPFLKTEIQEGKLCLLVRQATTSGYIMCQSDGVFDSAYPSSKIRRARVKDDGKIGGAVMAGETSYCVFHEYII